ncbi:MAG: pyridoxamine 5'-phosphate oxidase family protein [Pseudomonadota bacterium]
MSDAPFGFASSLPNTLETVWLLLARGVADRRAPERHPTLATIGIDHTPKVRTVVLRAADRASATLDIHTDLRSSKIAEIEANPSCGLHIWNPKQKLQMRLAAEANILTGEAVGTFWDRVPDGSRRAYGGDPAPGSPIASPEEFVPSAEFDRFAVLRLQLLEIETLCLAPDRHYRAVFRRGQDWAGQWLAP